MNAETLLNIKENVPLAPLTTLQVGGPGRFFVEAATEAQIAAALDHARARGIEVFVLGGGSNILISDAGFEGLVVHIALKGVAVEEGAGPEDGKVCVTAQAGEDWDGFVEYCVERNLAGLECLSGIPGLVGGTPVQNVGAYGQEVSESIVSVRCFDRERGEVVELSNRECGFSYRKSIFNSSEKDRYVVLAVTFALTRDGAPRIVYRDLQEFFEGREPGLLETRSAVLAIRAAKSMVIDGNDPNSRSAGSFFKNPVVPRGKLGTVASAAQVDAVPHFDAGGGLVKVPAAWLIERAGFHKGFVKGNAGISSNHSLAIVNRGGATSAEIVELKRAITAAVLEKFGIELVPEPVFIGFPGEAA